MAQGREVVSFGSGAGDHSDGRWLARREEKSRKQADKDAHYHENIWTKDPHGGRYRVSTGPAARKGYDALEETPDGAKVSAEVGYEKPQVGPTSNFVGNHMTQGAIDLVQGSLVRKDRDHERAKLEAYQRTYHPPKLVSSGQASEGAPLPVRKPLHAYRWWDSESVVTIEAPLSSNQAFAPVVLAEGTEFSAFAFRATVKRSGTSPF